MSYPDVVIIGGGIVGCACAYYLTRAGVKVTLVEKGPLGSGASKAGQTHIVTWEEPATHLDLAVQSDRLYQELSQELPIDIEYRKVSSIGIVELPEGLPAMQGLVGRLQARGAHCHLLSNAELRKLEPNIAPDLAGGALFEDDAQVNPLVTTQALAAVVRSSGGKVETQTEVTGFEPGPDKSSIQAVITQKGRIPTGQVVIAAGAWSGEVGKLAGIDLPVSPRKGVLVVTSQVPETAVFNAKIIFSAGYLDTVNQGASSGIAVAANLQKTSHGNLLLGSSRQFVGFDPFIDPQVVSLMLSRCLRFFPALARVTALRTWAGFRPYTPDLLPIISPVAEIKGLYIASGHEGIGITEAPITGLLISQMITGQELAYKSDKLSFSRFSKMTQPAQ